MKVALVYDRVNKWGGAERVLLALNELFPNAPLYTSVYSKKAKWAKVFQVRPSFLQRVSLAKTSHEYFALMMPIAFEQFSFDEYDVVISVTSEAAKGILTKPGTRHICYMLTPTRYLWSGYDEYFKNEILKTLAKPAVSYLRDWDLIASQRPDEIVAISEEVKKRIKKYYKRNAKVIYPPVSLNAGGISVKEKKPYFLVVSRLVPYKRVDLAVKACTMLNLPLIVIGMGSESKRLKAMAGPSVKFLGSLTDEELVGYYRGCTALLFPGREDFGLTVLEAQSYGKPVIAYRGGGAVETIINRKTGLFFYPQTANSLMNTLKKFSQKSFSARDCIEQAEKFRKQAFQEEILSLIKGKV